MNDIGLSSALLQRLAGSLLHFVWQGTLVAALAAVTFRLLRRRPAESRYTAGVIALGLMLIAPCVTFVFYAETGSMTLRILQFLHASATTAATADPLSISHWTAWIVTAWAAGTTACWIRLLIGWFLSRRIIRLAKEAVPPTVADLMQRAQAALPSGRRVRLLIGNSVDIPVTFGWLRPLILLPASALTGISEDQLFAILAHELAHIHRHDFLVNAVQRAAECALFYHPAVWWLSSRVREEREHCCDDLAVKVCGDRLLYARALMELERTRGAAPSLAIPAVSGSLTARIFRILGVQKVDSCRWQPAILALALVFLSALGGVWTTEAVTAPPLPLASLAPPIRAPIVPQRSTPAAAPTRETAIAAVTAVATAQKPISLPDIAGIWQTTGTSVPPHPLGGGVPESWAFDIKVDGAKLLGTATPMGVQGVNVPHHPPRQYELDGEFTSNDTLILRMSSKSVAMSMTVNGKIIDSKIRFSGSIDPRGNRLATPISEFTLTRRSPAMATLLITQQLSFPAYGFEGQRSRFQVRDASSPVFESDFRDKTTDPDPMPAALPPGVYILRTFQMVCNGNCGALGRPRDQCEAQFEIKAGQTLRAVSTVIPGTGCTIAFTLTKQTGTLVPSHATRNVDLETLYGNQLPALENAWDLALEGNTIALTQIKAACGQCHDFSDIGRHKKGSELPPGTDIPALEYLFGRQKGPVQNR